MSDDISYSDRGLDRLLAVVKGDRLCIDCDKPLSPDVPPQTKRCLECKTLREKESQKKWNEEHPEQVSRKSKKWRETHPEQWKEATRKNYEKQRDSGKLAAMPSKSREKKREYSRTYYQRKKSKGASG